MLDRCPHTQLADLLQHEPQQTQRIRLGTTPCGQSGPREVTFRVASDSSIGEMSARSGRGYEIPCPELMSTPKQLGLPELRA